MKKINSENIEQILKSLNRQIEVYGGKPVSIVVCGGAALFALGLIGRTTIDVDVLCRVIQRKNKISLIEIKELDTIFKKAAEAVKRDFGLPENWINIGPASQLKSGLPSGFEERLIKRVYGKYLTIYFISRLDQIHFKFYASIDSGGYHVEDLFALNPTSIEIGMAVEWVLTQDVSEGFRSLVKSFLKKKKYDEIAERI